MFLISENIETHKSMGPESARERIPVEQYLSWKDNIWVYDP